MAKYSSSPWGGYLAQVQALGVSAILRHQPCHPVRPIQRRDRVLRRLRRMPAGASLTFAEDKTVLLRREVVAGGLVSLIWGVHVCRTCAAQGNRRERILGCSIPADRAPGFFSSATESRVFVNGNEPMIPHSSDRAFDFALAQTLARLSKTFDVLPSFAYFDDFDQPNAYATPARRQNGGPDGTVLFGKRMLQNLLQRPEHPDVAVAAVCAHEFAHILQFKRRLDRPLQPPGASVRRVELQADFFAGYFAGLRKRERPDFPAAVFATTKHSLGDDHIHASEHHGTPDERAAAITQGFERGFRGIHNLSEAISFAVAYAQSV